jgi:glucan phosphoethanolaminetransferase (alkaline phosphatase superfamily)
MRKSINYGEEAPPRTDRAGYLPRYAVFTGLRIAASIVIILFFIRRFGFGTELVAYHTVAIVSLLLAEILFFILLINSAFFRDRRWSGAVLLVLQGLSLLVIFGCYALGYVSRALWGSYVTLCLIARFLPQFAGVIGALPVNPLLVVAGVLALPLAVAVMVSVLSSTLVYGLREVAALYNRAVVDRLRLQGMRIGVFIIVFTVGVAAPFAYLFGIPTAMAAGDPVISILSSGGSKQGNDIGNLGYPAARERSLYPAQGKQPKKNVILIICDALRRDHMSLYGYGRNTTPCLDGLYRFGAMSRQDKCFSTCSGSYCGILSTLASKSWNEIGISNFFLHDVLKDRGYRINFIVSGDHTSWENLKEAYGKSVDYFFDGSSSRQFLINDDLLLFEALDAVPAYDGRPNFFYFHLMSSHVAGIKHVMPYIPVTVKDLTNTGSARVCYTNNYDNGIVQADMYIEKIIAILKRKGYLHDFMAVITADHGEEIYENNGTGHMNDLNWYSVDIPLLIYESDPAVYVKQPFVSQIDIAPTVIDRLGLPKPGSWEGGSLLRTNPARCTIHQMRDYIAVITQYRNAIYKYIYNARSSEEQLFNITADIHEHENLIKRAPRVVIRTCRDKIKNSLGISIR